MKSSIPTGRQPRCARARAGAARCAAVLLASAAAGCSSYQARPEAEALPDPLVSRARATAEAFREADPALGRFFRRSAGYAVFPDVWKAAMGIGGGYGEGVLFDGGEPIGHVQLTQATIGAQLGGQGYAEIIFFETDGDLALFKGGNFELAAQASGVAVTKGASVNASFDGGVAVFTLPHAGMMGEASIGAQKFNYRAAPP